MSTTPLRADRERCISAGMCALTAPEVFDQDPDDGRVLLLQTEPPTAHRAAVRMAVGVCPSGAIAFDEPGTGGS
ncbi:ferredoxin [Streptomyces marispadix]|uniref:Ferredoxin n=1 Tax=Streptomyces marispadix TaxID=2922868 RepID=A0ABS9SZN8_9ACTN|nr:ferredoxin [Streptomyces marispadix]MCH6161747.1 ferredoxin [Streptomyces marispadix]